MDSSEWPPLLSRKLVPKPGFTSANGMRVLSFNVLADGKQGHESWASTPPDALDWRMRKWRLLEEITAHTPDIIMLQEVDILHVDTFFRSELSARSYDGVFQPGEANEPDGVAVFWHTSHFHKNTTIQFDQENVHAIAVVLKLMKTNTVDCCDITSGFVALSAHLCPGKNEVAEARRASQAQQILDSLESLKMPVLIGADFNAEPILSTMGVPPLAFQLTVSHTLGLQTAYEEPAYTTWKRRPKGGEVCRTIDYIFFTSGQFQVTATLSIPTPEEMPDERLPAYAYPSDHFALMSVFQPLFDQKVGNGISCGML